MSDKTKNRMAVCGLGDPRPVGGCSGIPRGQLVALVTMVLAPVVKGLARVIGRRHPPKTPARRFKAPRRPSVRKGGSVRELLEASPKVPRTFPEATRRRPALRCVFATGLKGGCAHG